MIRYPQLLFQFVLIRENLCFGYSWLLFSHYLETPDTPILPIFPKSYSLCAPGDPCGGRPIMQNKPNFKIGKIALTLVTKSFIDIFRPHPRKKQTQFKPNLIRDKSSQSREPDAHRNPKSRYAIRNTPYAIRNASRLGPSPKYRYTRQCSGKAATRPTRPNLQRTRRTEMAVRTNRSRSVAD